ncbi:hypothetical protein Taro_024445 [Colocasia esculenta]|uniref:NB-ARC domain-containing protein n=1 Tax=Colocasia esculenta TaxID=4460 RepID=A0A843VHG2_COLES|nr:hypothetical protein [Colocasia esculenta]
MRSGARWDARQFVPLDDGARGLGRVAKEIVEIRDRYEEICKDRQQLQLQPDEAPRRSLAAEAPPTAAMIRPDRFRILGRDRDRDNIVDLLLRRPAGPARPHVVPIYGMAGLGKTALAKYVYNDVRVTQGFKNRIWICTTRGFDVVKITREILQSLTGNVCHLSNLTTLQSCAKGLLAREPFLLVLDDVKDDGLHQHWEALQNSLPAVDGRSRVLMTTRSERVAQERGTLQPGRLNGLSEQDCLALFQQRACPEEGFLDQSPELSEISLDIARKCQGSPLAAISLGGALSRGRADEAEWRSMLEETAAFSQDGNQLDVLRVLNHSYELLPPHLKKCFAFCALFPPGHQFDRDELVKLWIAQGYIVRMGNRRLEAIGNRYFDELLWMSFFQASDLGDQNPECPKYEMPDLLHEVSQAVSKHECVRSVLSQDKPLGDVPMRARHLALCYHKEPVTFAGFPEHKRLRTLALQGESRIAMAQPLPGDLFAKLTHLRVLDLGNTGIDVLPDSIGELVLLRYLSLYNSPIERLPESVADLRNLQTLELGECYNLVKLPEGTSNLINLRHLCLHLDQQGASGLVSMPPGMGKLTSLQTLSRFAVGTRWEGCGISEMKNLTNLRGELWISKLENVASPTEATEANLKDKRYIQSLTLQWSTGSAGPSTQEQAGGQNVIDCLQPPSSIQHLSMDGYGGATPPSWMVGGSFAKLVSLRISNCTGWESLPPLGRLPALKELCIEGLHSITSMDPMFPGAGGGEEQRFPCLEMIRLSDLPWLERWTLAKDDMPCLSKIQIGRCPRLANLPVSPPSAVQVTVE